MPDSDPQHLLNVLQEESVRKDNPTDLKAQPHTLPPQHHHHKAAHAHSARANHHHSNHHTSKYDHFEFVDKKHQASIFRSDFCLFCLGDGMVCLLSYDSNFSLMLRKGLLRSPDSGND